MVTGSLLNNNIFLGDPSSYFFFIVDHIEKENVDYTIECLEISWDFLKSPEYDQFA